MKKRLQMVLLGMITCFRVAAQPSVEAVTGWIATVDETSQQIVLKWTPSATATTSGYHICSGTPCVDYDTVFGRFDTTYICTDHLATEPHIYRIHAFDSLYNASALTPYFGNMVLEADIPLCQSNVETRWTPYRGLPQGEPQYVLWGLIAPFDNAYRELYSTTDSNELHHTFTLPEGATHVSLKVTADGGGYTSLSNAITIQRNTADSAQIVAINSISYDSLHACITLDLQVDPRFTYYLHRSSNGSTWLPLSELHPTDSTTTYTDYNIYPTDTFYCYRLSVRDACEMNPRYSDTLCAIVPSPPEPLCLFPNAIIVHDEHNCTFLPIVRGLMGDLYELYIYNRQGMVVFHTSDPTSGWTPPQYSPQGTYTYFLHCHFNDNMVHTYRGTFTLIK